MRALLKSLLVCLLVLAIPAQGLAAATMAFCGPGHHGGGPAATQSAAMASEHSHHGAMAAHEHGVGAPADGVRSDEASATAKASPAAQQKCSACASCCSLGAMLSALPRVPAADPAPTVFVTVVPTVDAFAADGPDRPPRNAFA